YESLENNHRALLEERETIGNTIRGISLAAGICGMFFVASSVLFVTYYRKFKRQKKIVEKYKSELEAFNLVEAAQTLFKEDVDTRKAKIEEFEQKYGVQINPQNTLENILKNLETRKRNQK
ncbi:MAG: hypothetical protein ACLFU9_07215, partial [Candidatus Bathyarchaeia archaeon]